MFLLFHALREEVGGRYLSYVTEPHPPDLDQKPTDQKTKENQLLGKCKLFESYELESVGLYPEIWCGSICIKVFYSVGRGGLSNIREVVHFPRSNVVV